MIAQVVLPSRSTYEKDSAGESALLDLELSIIYHRLEVPFVPISRIACTPEVNERTAVFTILQNCWAIAAPSVPGFGTQVWFWGSI